MLYTGIDLIEIDRVARALRRHGGRFSSHVYTPGELAYAGGHVSTLAVRFAAKEAAAKALGTGLVGLGGGEGVRWTDVEVVSDAARRPSLKLHASAAERAANLRWREIALSLSHSHGYA